MACGSIKISWASLMALSWALLPWSTLSAASTRERGLRVLSFKKCTLYLVGDFSLSESNYETMEPEASMVS